VYFLQSEITPALIDAGAEVILLTDDDILNQIQKRFGREGLLIEGLHLQQAKEYFQSERNSVQWWLDFLRRSGASKKINLQALDSNINQVEDEAHSRRRRLFPLMKAIVWVLRNSRLARKFLENQQNNFTPDIYTDIFDRWEPDMVIASTPGWRHDRYLLREAASRGIPSGAVIVGWDNPSSYGLRGAPVDWVTCWSKIQKDELVFGSDWPSEAVNIGGIPSYDGYFLERWLLPREEYFHLHGLDPFRKLISYACSFISFSPNIQNIEALARLVSNDSLVEPSQLLIRLHPNHFMNVARFAAEREQIQQLVEKLPQVHLVEPVPLGGELGYYSGEDMPEKSSMMAYSDVFTTVYSTMVVEASIHKTPVIGVCIDSPVGWPGKYTLPLSEIGGWPTHSRYRESGAGQEVLDEIQLKDAINYFLQNPMANQLERQKFIERECTHTDGSAGRHTADFILTQLNNLNGK
ncbi:hypothetical protein ACFLUC_02200, partial [Chloroflexota bacterium]